MERSAPQDILRSETVGIKPPFADREVTLNNTHVYDFELKNGGSSGLRPQGFVCSWMKPCKFDCAMKHRLHPEEQDDLLRSRLID